ncbi:MAG: hypothetical protein IIB71_09640 [Proteobacteria bacterium]|nr:hypothetical protein [Pseudomonadota bacterium]
MLEHQETLYTIAEIAIALTGFSGIVMVFGKRVDSRSEEERVRLISMLRASLAAMILALFSSVIGLIPWTFQIFIIALIWMLFIASNHFVLLAVSSTSADTS